MSNFTKVSHKTKRRRGKVSQFDEGSKDYFERLKFKVLEAQQIVSASDVYCSIETHLEECLEELQQQELSDIVCYGLGNISEEPNSRFQFGLVLELKKAFKSNLFLYDPVFKKVEKDLMVNLDCSLIETNEMGNRKVSRTTLFFLPHCAHELLNNVIAANWGENLCNCIIVGNSVNEVSSNLCVKKLKESLPVFSKILPFVSEMEVHNNFKPVGAFNDLSVHIFVKDKYKDLICNVSEDEIDHIAELLVNKFHV